MFFLQKRKIRKKTLRVITSISQKYDLRSIFFSFEESLAELYNSPFARLLNFHKLEVKM